MVKAIVGANWGDEGKGKITDLLAEASDVVIRFQGGANAGHTIICDYGKFALHQLPSGVFYPHTTNIIGNGVALDVKKFLAELKHLADGGVPAPHIIVDQRTQLLMSYHVLLDSYEEERLAGAAFGSTKSGIAPFYSDKYAKIGIQVADLYNEERLMGQLEHICTLKNVLLEHLYHKPLLEPKALFDELMGYRAALEPYVGDAVGFVHRALKEGRRFIRLRIIVSVLHEFSLPWIIIRSVHTILYKLRSQVFQLIELTGHIHHRAHISILILHHQRRNPECFRHTVIVRTKRRRDMYDTRTILCRNEITRDHTECTFTRIYPWDQLLIFHTGQLGTLPLTYYAERNQLVTRFVIRQRKLRSFRIEISRQ